MILCTIKAFVRHKQKTRRRYRRALRRARGDAVAADTRPNQAPFERRRKRRDLQLVVVAGERDAAAAGAALRVELALDCGRGGLRAQRGGALCVS